MEIPVEMILPISTGAWNEAPWLAAAKSQRHCAWRIPCRMSFISVSVAAPTLSTATPPESFARRSWSFTKEYGQKPDALAVLGYDAANILIDAITRAGSTDSDKIREALTATKDYPAITGSTTLDDKHNAVKSAVIIEMKDGKQLFKATVKP